MKQGFTFTSGSKVCSADFKMLKQGTYVLLSFKEIPELLNYPWSSKHNINSDHDYGNMVLKFMTHVLISKISNKGFLIIQISSEM